jgi:hypothetical protein
MVKVVKPKYGFKKRLPKLKRPKKRNDTRVCGKAIRMMT